MLLKTISDIENRQDFKSISWNDYDENSSYYQLLEDVQQYELLRKNPSFDLGVDPVEKTFSDFFNWELYNRKTNARLLQDDSSSLARVITLVRDKLRVFMGHVPALSGHITSGSTTNCSTGNNPVDRFAKPEITEELYNYLLGFGPLSPHVPWDWRDVVVVRGSTTKVVPKTALVGRMVSPECAVNAYFQRGDGLYFRRRLQRLGINLETQPALHSMLAEGASIGIWDLSTEDATNASGLISNSLMKKILSSQWYSRLNALRSHRTYVKKLPTYQTTVSGYWELEHFMTQGNGFTFELETLIFYAIANVARDIHLNRCPGPQTTDIISVFGDDVIIPANVSNIYRNIMLSLGLMPNPSKSFSEGPFRESCGGHFHLGRPVKGVNLKRGFKSSFDLTISANLLYDSYHNIFDRVPKIYQAWLEIINMIPPHERLWGPCVLGDSVLHTIDKSLYQISYEGRHRKAVIRVWRTQFTEFTHIGEAIFQGIRPDTLLRLASAGLCKGLGLRRKRGVRLIEAQRLSAEGKDASFVEYAPYPKPGSRTEVVCRKGIYHEFPSLVLEDDPLSVFDIIDIPDKVLLCHKTYNARLYLTRKDLVKTLHAVRSIAKDPGVSIAIPDFDIEF